MINDMGITVYEKAPDAESLLLSDAAVSNDEDAADEAAAALATVERRVPVARRTPSACTCARWAPSSC